MTDTDREIVLVPVFFGPSLRNLLDHVFGYANKVRTKIFLFHVLENISRYGKAMEHLSKVIQSEEDQLKRIALEELDDVLNLRGHERDREQIPKIETRIGNGKVWSEVLRMAGNISAQHIFLGAHDRENQEEAQIGSNAQRIVTMAPCTVTVVRAPNPQYVFTD